MIKFLRKNNKNKHGFTLIELLVVVAIIGLLATISIIALNKARARARDARRVSDIKQIMTAMEMYYNNNGHYPEFLSITHCSVKNNNALGSLVTDGDISFVPTDPQFNQIDPNRQCYNYTGIGSSTSYPTASGLVCDGRSRTDYEWALMFSTESMEFDFPISQAYNYKYCVHGNLLPGK